MAENKEQVSPEEKLLKVIQGGQGKPDKPAAAAGAAATVSDPPKAGAGEKPKLKVTPVAAGDASAKPAASVAAAATPTLIGANPAPVVARKSTTRRLGIATANKFLAVVVLVILCFAAFEVWSNVMAMQAPSPKFTETPVGVEPESPNDLPPLAVLLQSFKDHPILGGPDQGPGPGPGPEPPKTPGWAQSVQQDFKLIGLSTLDGGGSEAIVKDVKQDRLSFLRIGQQIKVTGRDAEVTEIGADSVVLSSDGEKAVIK